MTVVAVPFAFVRRPLFFVVAFTVLGSLFIPFLAATLLFLNRLTWPPPVRRNGIAANALLGLILLLFLVIGGLEAVSILQSKS